MSDKTPSWRSAAANDARQNKAAPVISPAASSREREVKQATFNSGKRN